MLAEGELDAVFHSDLIKPFVTKDPRVARLFPDHKAEEMAYFKRTGIFPIMHVVGLRKSLADEQPWLAVNLFRAFNEAKAIAMKRMANPRIVPLAWYRDAWEEQERVLGADPWEYGLSEKNRKVLETLVGYSHEQGLIKKRPALDQLFLNAIGAQARRSTESNFPCASFPLVPAKAGTQGGHFRICISALDSRLRGNEREWRTVSKSKLRWRKRARSLRPNKAVKSGGFIRVQDSCIGRCRACARPRHRPSAKEV
jgi:hypothetical protein